MLHRVSGGLFPTAASCAGTTHLSALIAQLDFEQVRNTTGANK